MLYIGRLRDMDQAHAAGAKERGCSIGLEQPLSFAPAAWAHYEGQRTRRVFGSHVVGHPWLVPGEQWRCRRHWDHAVSQPERARPNAPELVRWLALRGRGYS